MSVTLTLFEDTMSADATLDGPLPARPRMVFVVHGAATIDGRTFADGEAWFGEGEVTIAPGDAGFQKLGQPVPESNFVSELNSGCPQQTQL